MARAVGWPFAMVRTSRVSAHVPSPCRLLYQSLILHGVPFLHLGDYRVDRFGVEPLKRLLHHQATSSPVPIIRLLGIQSEVGLSLQRDERFV